MKKLLILVFCLSITALMLYQTGFFTYIQNDSSLPADMRVEVVHNEYQRAEDGTGIVPFDGSQRLRPEERAYSGSPYLQQFDSFLWNGDSNCRVNFWSGLTYAVDKIVTATNTGNIPVYVRMVFAFEHLECNVWKNVCTAGSSYGMIYHGTISIHGNQFDLYSYTYSQPIQPGETTMPSLLQIALDPAANSDDYQIIASGYEILTASQVCQAVGLPEEFQNGASAEDVIDTLLGRITTENHPWIGH